jgi:hypothetical protein
MCNWAATDQNGECSLEAIVRIANSLGINSRNCAGSRRYGAGAQGAEHMACWGAGVIVLSPRGLEISQTKLPGLEVTNLVFGGADRRTLYLAADIAGAVRGSKSGQLLALNWPRPGAAL